MPNVEIQKSKSNRYVCYFGFRILTLFGFWCLSFGISPCSRFPDLLNISEEISQWIEVAALGQGAAGF